MQAIPYISSNLSNEKTSTSYKKFYCLSVGEMDLHEALTGLGEEQNIFL